MKDMTYIQPEFAKAVVKTLRKHTPRFVIETGTYTGEGSTRLIGRELIRQGSNAKFFTIELNLRLAQVARSTCRQVRAIQLHGLSIERDDLPTLPDIVNMLEGVPESIKVDHHAYARARAYLAEQTHRGPDDQLGEAFRRCDGRPDFILLDSAGHLGWLEFSHLMGMLVNPCVIALDDCDHLKHFQSAQRIREDRRFTVIEEGQEHHSWIIAAFDPQGGDGKGRPEITSPAPIQTKSANDLKDE